uniref:hypothetical protein n=1 Tax=Anabaena sp. (strain CA / ATCC 33047) TaxID=52271 RepID=UPI0008341852
MPPHPSPYASGNHDSDTQLLQPEAQPTPGEVLPPHPSPYASGNHDSDTQLLQPEAPQQAEETILQPRPSPHPNASENLAVGQINNQQASNLENTLHQPQPVSSDSSNKTPDVTLLEPKPNNLAAPRNPNLSGRNLGIGLAIVLAFLAGIYIFLQTDKGSRNSPVPSQIQN